MTVFIIGLIVFFGIHSIRMLVPGLRLAGTERFGEQGWKGIYSLVSLAGLVLIVWGWIIYRAEAPIVFDPPEWGRHAAYLLVFLAFVLIIASNLPAGQIKAATRHPFLMGIFFWSLAHLLVNGDLASLILFGAMFAYSVINRIAVAFRPDPGPQFVAYHFDLIAVVVGAALYAAFLLFLHEWLFGVTPVI